VEDAAALSKRANKPLPAVPETVVLPEGVVVSVVGTDLLVTYETFAGYTLLETQLYANDTQPYSIFITPEDYGQITHADLNYASTDSFSVGGLDYTPFYIVAYASVAGVN
jgi:hypothetical protein